MPLLIDGSVSTRMSAISNLIMRLFSQGPKAMSLLDLQMPRIYNLTTLLINSCTLLPDLNLEGLCEGLCFMFSFIALP